MPHAADVLRDGHDFVAARLLRKRLGTGSSGHSLRIPPVENEHLICYSKTRNDGANVIVTVVGLDPYARQSGWIDRDALRIEPHAPSQVHDLLTGARHLWFGCRNFVQFDPSSIPVRTLRLRRHARCESAFEYFC